MYNAKRTNARNDFDDDDGTTVQLTVAGHRFDLVARCPVGGNWVAWVRRSSEDGAGETLLRPLLVAGQPVRGLRQFVADSRSTGATADAALTMLADTIRAAVGEATRADPEIGGYST